MCNTISEMLQIVENCIATINCDSNYQVVTITTKVLIELRITLTAIYLDGMILIFYTRRNISNHRCLES